MIVSPGGLIKEEINKVLPGDIAVQLKTLLKLVQRKEPMEVNVPFMLWLKRSECDNPEMVKIQIIPMMFLDVTKVEHWEQIREYLQFTIEKMDKEIVRLKNGGTNS